MRSFLVTTLDQITGAECRFVVQAKCIHGMQEFVDKLAKEGKLDIAAPVIIDIDERTAAHLPVIDPAGR